MQVLTIKRYRIGSQLRDLRNDETGELHKAPPSSPSWEQHCGAESFYQHDKVMWEQESLTCALLMVLVTNPSNLPFT